MKKLILLFALFASILFTEKTFAQITIHANIGIQPLWGPVGYDYVEYYYLPDIETYYNVSSRKYIYLENGRWISRSYLPERNRNYDIYHSRRVVINEYKPYLNHHNNGAKYSNWHDQSGRESIRDSREPRYYESRHHPNHSQYKDYRRNEEHNRKNNSYNEANNNNNSNSRDQHHRDKNNKH